MKRIFSSSTPAVLIYAGLFFLILGVIEIVVGIKGNSIVVGTIYIVGAVICNTVIMYSLPVSIINNIKPEIIDLLEWSKKNIPESNHPDLCSDFVVELRKKFDAVMASHPVTDS